jgi:hypothetical protein
MYKKRESTSMQPRPGRVTRKGIQPNPPNQNLKKPGRNIPAKGFNPVTKTWDTQTH